MRSPEQRVADVLVVGAGVAGMTTALSLARRRVVLVTEADPVSGTATAWALGGVAAALGSEDSPDLHARDTIAVGGGIVDPELARILSESAPRAIEWLASLGAQWDRMPNGSLRLGREAGHSRSRVVHARGDATGAEVAETLAHAVRRAENIQTLKGFRAVGLLLDRNDRVRGAAVLSQEGASLWVKASAVVLATGGVGHLFRWTTNPSGAWASGWYLAAQVGAVLADCEFVQFHPTALRVSGLDPMPLLTEALRGAGAVLVDERGRRFLLDEDPRGELAPRDVVARAMWRAHQRGTLTFLDARAAVGERFPEQFPTVWTACLRAGIDPRREPIPCGPAAHYAMGGVAVDAWGRTSIPGLYAVGEVAASGLHGANRLASNSLLEGLVFGARVAQSVDEDVEAAPGADGKLHPARPADGEPSISRVPNGHEAIRHILREQAWEALGLERDEASLKAFLNQLKRLWSEVHGSFELEARVFALTIMASAALRRRESRGAHFRRDFPVEVPQWQRHQRIKAEWDSVEFKLLFDDSTHEESKTKAGASE